LFEIESQRAESSIAHGIGLAAPNQPVERRGGAGRANDWARVLLISKPLTSIKLLPGRRYAARESRRKYSCTK